MKDFFLGLAFVLMILVPAIIAHFRKTDQEDQQL